MKIWKDIEGFEGLYKISNYGEIKSLGNGNSTNPKNNASRILKQREKKNGYMSVKLCKDGKNFHKSVHRLVALTFLFQTDVEVNHKDGDKKNNHVSNLEWVSPSQNQKHAFKLGLQKVYKGSDSKCSKGVRQLDLSGKLVNEFGSINEVKRELGFNSVGIIGCCKNKPKYKTAYGYKWEYV